MPVRTIRKLNEAKVKFDREIIHAFPITDIINNKSFYNVDVIN